MRFSWKQIANIVVVSILGLAATVWAVFGLANVKFDDPDMVTVRLASSGGALPGGEVTYLGVPVGRVESARLVSGALELKLAIRPKGPMPRNLRADVRQKTALGEPYVDLAPAEPGAPAGDVDGAVVPIERTRVPRTLDRLLQEADQLLADVDTNDLSTLVEAGGGLSGHGEDLRAMTESGARLGRVLSERTEELGRLIVASADVVEALDANQAALAGSLSSGARLTEVFARHTGDLVKIMDTGAKLGTAGADLMQGSRAAWDGTLAGFDASSRNLAENPQRTEEILRFVPPYLVRIARTFDQGLAWSSNGGVPGLPYQPIYAIPLGGEGLHIDQIFLPSVAGKIRADFGGQDPKGAMLFLTPEEAQRASASPEAFEQVKQEALAELRRVGGTMRTGSEGPDGTG